MVPGFKKLSESQYQATKDALVWITVLIAGADGEIDEKETNWAEKITQIRGYHNPNSLTAFYDEVGHSFSEDLTDFIKRAPSDVQERSELIVRKLTQLNDILGLLDNDLAYELYSSYQSFAEHIAKASGGFLGFMRVNSDEEKFLNLPMINEIILEEEE